MALQSIFKERPKDAISQILRDEITPEDVAETSKQLFASAQSQTQNNLSENSSLFQSSIKEATDKIGKFLTDTVVHSIKPTIFPQPLVTPENAPSILSSMRRVIAPTEEELYQSNLSAGLDERAARAKAKSDYLVNVALGFTGGLKNVGANMIKNLAKTKTIQEVKSILPDIADDVAAKIVQSTDEGVIGRLLKQDISIHSSKLPAQQAIKAEKEIPHLTTKFLSYIDDKLAKDPNATLSRQEILDFAKRPELKKGEADLLNRLGIEIKDTKISAQEFADSIRRDLLELKPVKVKEPQYGMTSIGWKDSANKNVKYVGKNYEEVVFESPITTNGSSHFPNSKNYFAHARGDEVVEGGKKIWREQEIQSDLLQKEGMMNLIDEGLPSNLQQKIRKNEIAGKPFEAGLNKRELDLFEANKQRFSQLSAFTNDRFGERIMRERIKEKASKGYSKYRLPTGETIGRIEGFQARHQWFDSPMRMTPQGTSGGKALETGQLKLGKRIWDNNNESWIVSKIEGETGRFSAIQERTLVSELGGKFQSIPRDEILDFVKNCL